MTDRIVTEIRGDHATFHTTFPMGVMNRLGERTEAGDVLYKLMKSIPGVSEDELAVQLNNHFVWISKLHAFDWKREMVPTVVKILQDRYGLTKIELKFE